MNTKTGKVKITHEKTVIYDIGLIGNNKVYDIQVNAYRVSVKHKINQEFMDIDHFDYKFKINNLNGIDPNELHKLMNFDIYVCMKDGSRKRKLEVCNYLRNDMLGTCQNVKKIE